MGLFAPIRNYVDTLVHPSAQQDALTASRHRAFIAPRLFGSLVALASFPVYLTMRGVPSMLEVLVISWLVAPILIAYFLSRTGQYESAHVLSSLALTSLVIVVAAETGGMGSFAAIWLVVVPLEAALSASRREQAASPTLRLGPRAAAAMHGFDLLPAGMPPRDEQAALAALGIISARALCHRPRLGAGCRANEFLAARGGGSAACSPAICRRHHAARAQRAVRFVSPAAEQLFGAPARELLGHGLFDRVHVADRPAYLTALADSAALGDSRSVEFRVRRDPPEPTAHSDGQFVWIEMRCRALDQVVGEGHVAHDREVVAVMRDITRRKEQEQEQALEDARAEAERANAAKSRFWRP